MDLGFLAIYIYISLNVEDRQSSRPKVEKALDIGNKMSYFRTPMKKWFNLLIIIPFGFFIITTLNSCESADAQQSQIDTSGLQSDTRRPPGPDNNPATYDENPDNLPLSTVRTYINSAGTEVQSPTAYKAPPPGSCAICRDGTYSQSKRRPGTCSRHGGVKEWLLDLP